jgi:hypothetical protein
VLQTPPLQAAPAPTVTGVVAAKAILLAASAASWRTQRIRSAAAWEWSPNSCAIRLTQPRVPNRRTAQLVAAATLSAVGAADRCSAEANSASHHESSTFNPGPRSPPPPLMCLPGRDRLAGRRATARLAARQLRRRHRITVIRPTGAPQNRSTTDRRECAGCGPLLPPPWNALLRVPVRARLGRPAAQRARRAHRAAGPVGTIRRARRDRGVQPGSLEVSQLTGTANHQDQVTPANRDGG